MGRESECGVESESGMVQAKDSRRAGLTLCEVLALRLYTTRSGCRSNADVRGCRRCQPATQ
eukprot:3645169-Rhodomonas_salina.4